jgi:hypothetical protein
VAALLLDPRSEPLPESGEALLQKLRVVFSKELGKHPSTGWWVAIDQGTNGLTFAVWRAHENGSERRDYIVRHGSWPHTPQDHLADALQKWKRRRIEAATVYKIRLIRDDRGFHAKVYVMPAGEADYEWITLEPLTFREAVDLLPGVIGRQPQQPQHVELDGGHRQGVADSRGDAPQ